MRLLMLAVAGTVILSLLMGLGVAEADEPLLPVPPAADLAKSRQFIQEIYQLGLKDNTPASHRKLAKKMIDDSAGMKNDPVGRFALLGEARDLAVAAGDAQTAVMAITELGQSFAIDRSALAVEALTTLSPKNSASAEDQGMIVETAMRVLEAVVQEERYDLATKLIATLHSAAARCRKPPLMAAARTAAANAELAIAEYEKAKPSFEKLKLDPADKLANTVVGKFFCFQKGNWEKGLAALARGSDPQLQMLAKADLGNPADAMGCKAVADGWWEYSSSAAAATKSASRFRAAMWYQHAVDNGLTGLAKTLAQHRIAEAGPAPAAPQVAAGPTPPAPPKPDPAKPDPAKTDPAKPGPAVPGPAAPAPQTPAAPSGPATPPAPDPPAFPTAAPADISGNKIPVAGTVGELVRKCAWVHSPGYEAQDVVEGTDASKPGWRTVPPVLQRLKAISFSVPKSGNSGIAEFEVTRSGFLLLTCNWSYQGNGGGDWKKSRLQEADFIQRGWQKVDNSAFGGKLVRLENGGAEQTFFIKHVEKGEKYELRCNKYFPPYPIVFR